jgi:hypothetical protein
VGRPPSPFTSTSEARDADRLQTTPARPRRRRRLGLDTTHFGNNAALTPGRYAVKVSVNGAVPADFHVDVTG